MVVDFLCHDAIFHRMSCIYMILTCHKINNLSNLLLGHLQAQVEHFCVHIGIHIRIFFHIIFF
jgi:hypothetical protein